MITVQHALTIDAGAKVLDIASPHQPLAKMLHCIAVALIEVVERPASPEEAERWEHVAAYGVELTKSIATKAQRIALDNTTTALEGMRSSLII